MDEVTKLAVDVDWDGGWVRLGVLDHDDDDPAQRIYIPFSMIEPLRDGLDILMHEIEATRG